MIVSLPLLLGGCGGEKKVVDFDLIEKRESIRYLKDSDTPYTGKLIALHDKERKENDDRIEVDERRRLLMSMPDEPYKFLKELPEEDLRVWLYAYDHYKKAKNSLSYVLSADQISSGEPQR
ncbi:MAG: hypothetical protein GY899_08280 [Verrucomicrobiaceae bacterium]|nr:hypothetical protein [Verrucomicrobiaceae bacterium]